MQRRFTIAGVGAGVMLAAGAVLAQSQAAKPLPYVAVHDPEFIRVADAAFMKDEDRVIGLDTGNTHVTGKRLSGNHHRNGFFEA